MNKTMKRAIQKHRAKKLKYEARRKANPPEAVASGSTTGGSAAMSRAKQPARPRPATGPLTPPAGEVAAE